MGPHRNIALVRLFFEPQGLNKLAGGQDHTGQALPQEGARENAGWVLMQPAARQLLGPRCRSVPFLISKEWPCVGTICFRFGDFPLLVSNGIDCAGHRFIFSGGLEQTESEVWVACWVPFPSVSCEYGPWIGIVQPSILNSAACWSVGPANFGRIRRTILI